MAANINLHRNTFNFSLLSLPLHLSPPSFFSLRFAPRNRRVSSSSFLAKLSFDSSSEVQIISRTEHSDGTVSFKFSDTSEVSQGLESVDHLNGVELESDNGGVSSVIADENEGLMTEKIVVTSVKLKDIGSDSSSVGEELEDSGGSLVDDGQDCNSSLVEAVENSSDYEAVKNENEVVEEEVENLIDFEAVKNENEIVEEEEVENSSDFKAVKNENEVVEEEVENSSDFETVKNENEIVEQEVENSSDFDAVKSENEVVEEVENSGDFEAVTNENEVVEEVENLSDFEVVKNESVVVGGVVNDVVANIEEAEHVSVASEKTDDKLENGGDESTSAIISEEITDGDRVESVGNERTSSVEGPDVVVVSVKDDNAEPEENNAVADDMTGSDGDESSLVASVEASDGGKLEYASHESLSNLEASEVAVALKDNDDDGGSKLEELMSTELEAQPIVDEDSSVVVPSSGLENGKVPDAASLAIVEFDVGHSSTDLKEDGSADRIMDSVNFDVSTGIRLIALAAAELAQCSEVLEADNCSTVRLDDDSHNLDTSETAPAVEVLGITSEITLDRENSSDIEHECTNIASSPHSSEVNGASPNLSQSDDQPSSDILQESVSGPDTLKMGSENVNNNSQEISAVSHSMTPSSATSLDSTEVYDTATDSILESGNLSDVLLAADPVTSEITSAEITLDSLNEMKTSAPVLFTSSAGASVSPSVEALAGGKDAYFVSEDWFGVADGVGQWSLEGVDIGLYAHDLMQNCEKLIKSMNNGVTNVTELLKQSDSITEPTGSARVVIAHVANQVLHVANIGDSGFMIIRNGIVFKKSSSMVHEFGFPYAIGLGDDSVEDIEEYHVELEDGDVIVTATDGLFDNLYEEDIASIVSNALGDGMHVQDIATLLATKAQEVGKSDSARSPFADAAQAAGHPGYNGGKHDHVTVILSLVQMT